MNKQESLEQELRGLILAIQNCDLGERQSQRRKNLHRFFKLLEENFWVYKPKHEKVYQSCKVQLSPGIYEEICDEARSLLWALLNEMMKDESKKYDPERAPAIAWIRFYMNIRCLPKAIKNIMGQYQDWSVDIESYLNSHTYVSEALSEQIKMVLELDPSGEFKRTHIQGNPAANFQVLALRVYERKSWEDLANELNEKVSTLSGFFQKWLTRKFAAYIRSYIQENF